jgi:integrase/recombinase XerD
MNVNQLALFLRKRFDKPPQRQTIEPVAPTGESTVMQTLPAYLAHLQSNGYSESTTEKYFADVKRFSLFIREKQIGEVTNHDIEQWIGGLLSKDGGKLDPKTVNRKVSAIINYFLWLRSVEAIIKDPTASLSNNRIHSPLPDYLYENELKELYTQASKDPRTYLLVLLLLETGMKSNELFTLTKADVDISDPYRPEIWIKHSGKNTKKDRKVALPPQFSEVYTRYLDQYQIEDALFPYTDRLIQLLFADLKKQTKIDKELTPKTLRHTHVVRGYRQGEHPDTIFERIGLAPYSRPEADEMYTRLARSLLLNYLQPVIFVTFDTLYGSNEQQICGIGS